MFTPRILSVATRSLRFSPAVARALHVEASKSSINGGLVDFYSSLQDAIAKEKVLIFSKTHCPYCARVKAMLDIVGATYQAVELDTKDDGAAIQSLLLEITGQRTVPNVFINGKHVGGCDDVMALHAKHELVPLLQS
ncbi:hypothetical protein PsorP6_009325 [Peronosclerospora sorghi]|uniref:Uncharacterized protein n=1 Tax=Peronosclerospora sorghi TaxID=230839 RepID=A0ACC0VZB1_9STRA|nr:hypothetical protein PsorP6_009325 [Peronosclerospora sorghi]